jgi:hypothetical protein
MKIIYRVTEDDFQDAYKLFVANEKWSRRMSRRIMPWLGGVMSLLAILIYVRGADPLVSLSFGLMGGYFLYCGFALRRLFRTLYKNDQRFKDEVTADISEDGVHVVTPSTDSQLKWTAIVRFLESDRVFMFFYAAWTFSVVPKRAFADGELEPFRELLQRKVSISK